MNQTLKYPEVNKNNDIYLIGKINYFLMKDKTKYFIHKKLLLSDQDNLFIIIDKGYKPKNDKIEFGNFPGPNKKYKFYIIGTINKIFYQSATKKDLYQHTFKIKRPYLIKNNNNYFIIKNNKKMYFDPKRGIIN